MQCLEKVKCTVNRTGDIMNMKIWHSKNSVRGPQSQNEPKPDN